MLAFLQDLIRIPSVNGRHPEKAIAERILTESRKLGFRCRLEAKENARPNVLVAYGEGKTGFALIGHLDTVAEGTLDRWNHPPFAAEIQDDKLFGRGAADNKAGIACGLYAMVLLRELNLLDPATQRVILAGVADEESGACSTLGVRHLLDLGLLPVQGAIYTYASDIVCIGHRGLIRLKMKAQGQSVHAGLLEWHQHKTGVNAVTGLADLLLRLEKMNVHAPSQPGFEKLGCTITPGTRFTGGSYDSIVPDKADAVIDIRLMPGQDTVSLMTDIGSVISKVLQTRPGLQITYHVKVNIPGASIPLDHPLVITAQDFSERLTGKRWLAEGAGPANEGYMLIGSGIPTLCGFGPTGGNPHAPDEWVSIRSLPITAAMFAGIIHDYVDKVHKGD